jgi:hypothetical protein
MPLRPSTASIATRIRICGVIWITAHQFVVPTTLGPARPDPAPPISGPDGGTLEIDRMTDEELDQRINELLAKLNSEAT